MIAKLLGYIIWVVVVVIIINQLINLLFSEQSAFNIKILIFIAVVFNLLGEIFHNKQL